MVGEKSYPNHLSPPTVQYIKREGGGNAAGEGPVSNLAPTLKSRRGGRVTPLNPQHSNLPNVAHTGRGGGVPKPPFLLTATPVQANPLLPRQEGKEKKHFSSLHHTAAPNHPSPLPALSTGKASKHIWELELQKCSTPSRPRCNPQAFA